jgi:hypothetical protein
MELFPHKRWFPIQVKMGKRKKSIKTSTEKLDITPHTRWNY